MHDILYQRKGQGLTTQANSSGNKELGREQLPSKQRCIIDLEADCESKTF